MVVERVVWILYVIDFGSVLLVGCSVGRRSATKDALFVLVYLSEPVRGRHDARVADECMRLHCMNSRPPENGRRERIVQIYQF